MFSNQCLCCGARILTSLKQIPLEEWKKNKNPRIEFSFIFWLTKTKKKIFGSPHKKHFFYGLSAGKK